MKPNYHGVFPSPRKIYLKCFNSYRNKLINSIRDKLNFGPKEFPFIQDDGTIDIRIDKISIYPRSVIESVVNDLTKAGYEVGWQTDTLFINIRKV